MVTHEMDFAARVADTIIYMHEGKVWETGSGDMLKNPQTPELRDFLSTTLIRRFHLYFCLHFNNH